jgi:glycosyltransferase involved in cell wall biosynthesis
MRIIVVQRFLPHYRYNFYENVAKQANVSLLYSCKLGEVSKRKWQYKTFGISINIKVGHLKDKLVISPFVIFDLYRIKPSIVVLEDISGLPNSLMAMIYCKITRTPYLIWGLGNIPSKKRSILRKLLNPCIEYLYKNSSGFLGYSRHACNIYSAIGKPTYWVPNATLNRPSTATVEKTLDLISQKYDVQNYKALRILFIGRLLHQKKVDLLIYAISTLKIRVKFCLDIIGDGPCAKELQEQVNQLEIQDKVTFHGAIYDEATKNKIIGSCHISVIPGLGGLAVQESMANGLPVLCGSTDGTEKDHIINGVNGYLVSEPITVEIIQKMISKFCDLSLYEKEAVSRAALSCVSTNYNSETMANAFVASCLATKGQH